MSMFVKPTAPGDGIKWENHKGALLFIEPLSIEVGVKTVHGETDAVKANVVVLDGKGAGEDYKETLIFPKLLISQTKSEVGKRVLGRLGQGNAKPGQSAPWILLDPSDADIELAEAWLSKSKPIVSADAPF